MEMIKKYLVKEVLLKSAYPNALYRHLLGLGHDIPNLSSTPLGNGRGFTVMPH